MCVLTMLKISENNGTEEIGLVTPTPELHPTLYNGCNYLSMLGLKLNHVSKRGPWYLIILQTSLRSATDIR